MVSIFDVKEGTPASFFVKDIRCGEFFLYIDDFEETVEVYIRLPFLDPEQQAKQEEVSGILAFSFREKGYRIFDHKTLVVPTSAKTTLYKQGLEIV